MRGFNRRFVSCERANFQGLISVFITGTLMGLGACESTGAPAVAALDGPYNVTWTRSSGSCTPQALPAPLSGDSSQYAQIPAGSATHLTMQLSEKGDSVFISPTTATGAEQEAVTLRGFAPTGSLLRLSRAISRTEGPRAGGHTFSVTETLEDSGALLTVRTHPPDSRIEATFNVSGQERAVFREGSSAGPVFTTCIVLNTMFGERS